VLLLLLLLMMMMTMMMMLWLPLMLCAQVYTGVSRLGYIQPQTLATQDIVVTSYETLRKEIDYVDLPHTNSQLCTS